jgi:hypothetical protein
MVGKEDVLSITLIMLLTWAGLVVLLWAGTLWFQDYIYSEPAEGLAWRAPAAASVLALFLALCCLIDSRSTARYFSPIEFSASDVQTFPELWAVRDGKKIRYTLGKDERGRLVYLDNQRKPLPRPVDEVIVKEDGEEVVFKPELDDEGHYKREKVKSLIGPNLEKPLRYLDDHGRVMTEDRLGEISQFRWGVFLSFWFLNLLHLGLWFSCLWLLLRFQWSHALGLSLIFWLAMTTLMVTLVLPNVEHHTPSPAAAGQNSKYESRKPKQIQMCKIKSMTKTGPL